jgi:hypothetical protein
VAGPFPLDEVADVCVVFGSLGGFFLGPFAYFLAGAVEPAGVAGFLAAEAGGLVFHFLDDGV